MDETRRMPPLDGTRWDASERFRSVYEGLSNLEPRDYRLSPQAFNAFNAWHMECESDRVDASNGLVKATISKYKGMAASVALILHCLNGIAAGETVSGIISESTMINAIEFTRWAIKQAKSLFAVNAITTDEETALLNRFVERFDGKGWVTGDIARSWWPSKKKPGRKEVREFLHGLVTSGVAIDNGEKPEKTTYSISLNLKNVVHSSKKSEPLVSQGFETGRKFRPVVVQNVVQKYPDVVQTDPDEDPIQSGRTLDESGRTLDESIVRPQTHTPQGFEKKTDEWTKKPDESENGRTDEAANSDNIDCNQSIELSPEVAAELAAIELFLGDLADEFK
ncbi:MAG: hypothetical protein DDT26_00835 [Dehalococcoidia bacterium]|nr:hypothetical protein [Chloroflexota bacterium]